MTVISKQKCTTERLWHAVLEADGLNEEKVREFRRECRDFHSFQEKREELVFSNAELASLKLFRTDAITKRVFFPKDALSEDLTRKASK